MAWSPALTAYQLTDSMKKALVDALNRDYAPNQMFSPDASKSIIRALERRGLVTFEVEWNEKDYATTRGYQNSRACNRDYTTFTATLTEQGQQVARQLAGAQTEPDR